MSSSIYRLRRSIRTLKESPMLLQDQTSLTKALNAIELFKNLLLNHQRLSQDRVIQVMAEVSGGTAAQGCWNWKEAYDLVEASFAKIILEDLAFADYQGLHKLVPHQSARSEHQLEMQQFSTPLPIGDLVASAAQINKTDLVLEPSAGTGLLAAFAARKTQKLMLNELCSDRAMILAHIFPNIKIYNYNAENLNDYLALATDQQPTVVLMNPPFSSSPNMAKRNRQAVFAHVRSALDRLEKGGRLVAVAPHWFNPEMCDCFKKYDAQLLLSAYISGSAYRYHGTNMETRLLVFDKTENQGPVRSVTPEFDRIIDLIELLPPRQVLATEAITASKAVTLPPKPLDVLWGMLSEPQIAKPAKKQAPALPVVPQIAGFNNPVRLAYQPAEQKEPTTLGEGIYEPYSSSPIKIFGAARHPTDLVESIAMASVSMPRPTYQPLLPSKVIQEGILSDAQLEAIIFAGESHKELLDAHWIFDLEKKEVRRTTLDLGTQYRRGFWIGDGTGVGKGREVSGIFLDNWMQGRKRGLWLSKNPTLLEDARRDWQSLGGNPEQIVLINKYKQNESINLTEGILFVPYGTLRVGEKQGKQSRLDQILKWLGEDWDGCICFDEAHMMGNAINDKSDRGTKSASQQGLAGLELQNRLPNARVTYVSATGASKVANLAYATRLGLWQTDQFPFASRANFLLEMERSGIAALEVVIRDLKSMGLYMARALSYNGIQYETLCHNLSPEQTEIYAKYATAFQYIHQNIGAALEATNNTSPTGKCRNGNTKSAAISAFEGMKQRFFNHLITAAKFPSVVEALESDLKAGHAPVLQIVSTDEALLERKLAEIPASEWGNMRLDFTPREAIVDYLMNSFPIQLQEVYADENGREHSRLATSEDGTPILCQKALAIRDSLIEDIAMLPSVAGFLDQLIWHFGPDVVAEVTGRSKRVVLRDDIYKLESRSDNANLAETQAFQDDRKQILIFSAAGGTGRSYHACLKAKNQRLRRHYLIQSGWEASAAVQSLGRSHRSNQKQPPGIILCTTNVKGEARFTATIASRLSGLGALTRGQRQTGSQGIYNEDVSNLTSSYAKAALGDFYNRLYQFGIGSYSIGQFSQLTGLRLLAEEGALRDDLPSINTFLNRLLALAIPDQNELFSAFEQMLLDRVQAAKDSGYYEVGVEDLVADGGFNILNRKTLFTHPGGSKTICYEVEKLTRPLKTSVARAKVIVTQDRTTCLTKDNKVAIKAGWGQRNNRDGDVLEQSQFTLPGSRKILDDLEIIGAGWIPVQPSESFWQRWEEEVSGIPDFESSKLYLICGLLLPIWDRLPKDSPKINRLQANDGNVLLGRTIGLKELAKLYSNFNMDTPELSTEDIFEQVWNLKMVAQVGRWKLARSYWKGNHYLEVIDVSSRDAITSLKAIGCMTEIISSKMRVYLPINDSHRIIDQLKILK